MAKNRYFKLGNGTLFNDPYNKITIVNKEVIELNVHTAVNSKRLNDAKKSGHVVEATEEEYKAYLKSLKPKKEKPQEKETPKEKENIEEEDDFDEGGDINPTDMKVKDLRKYIQKYADLTEEEEEAIGNMKKKELLSLYDEYFTPTEEEEEEE